MNTFRGYMRITASARRRQRCVVQLAPCHTQVTQTSDACAMPEKVRNVERL